MKHIHGRYELRWDATVRQCVLVDSETDEIAFSGIEFCPFCGDIIDNMLFCEPLHYCDVRDMRCANVAACGRFLGYKWYVVDLHKYPTAYIEVNEMWGKETDQIELTNEPHGGITWSDKEIPSIAATKNGHNWYIGWDYGHCGDYYGGIHSSGRKWKTEEIIDEIKNVIGGLTH